MRALFGLFLQRIKARLAYRGDLVAGLLSAMVLASVGPIFILTLFQHIPHLGGWTGAQVLFIWGFTDTVSGLFYVLFQALYVLNRRYILGGELDRLMLRPVDPLLHLLVDNVAIEELPSVGLGMVVMGIAVSWGLPEVAPWRWAMLPFWVLGGLAVLGGLVTAVATLGFHLHHRGTAVGLVLELNSFTRYPLDLFGAPLRWLLTVALPFGFAGFYGAAFFLGNDDWLGFALVQPLVGLACLAVARVAWQLGLRRYGSAGG